MAEEKKSVKVEAAKSNRVFLAKSWTNTNEDGSVYQNLSFDRRYQVSILDTETDTIYEIGEGVYIQGNDNVKREGKKDADIRWSFKKPEDAE